MKQIKFKAKIIGYFDWAFSEGFLKHNDGTITIITKTNAYGVETSPIKKETLCQFIGRKDKKGTDIYENDEILYHGSVGVVYYSDENCMYMAKFEQNRSLWSFDSMDDEIEVIGNIYDNPKWLRK